MQPQAQDKAGFRGGRTAAFHRDIPPLARFSAVAEPQGFTPLPDDWVIGLADVVSSTEAISEGRYKTVNTAGAAVISAVSNAIGTLDFPFLFAGDGASFAVGPDEAPAALAALAATVSWVGRELDLVLRGGAIGVGAIRASGQDVRVARFAASPDATYAMFSGGGLGWAERRLKAGSLALPPAPAEAQPDLSGLSCRFQDIVAKHGVILSLMVRPRPGADADRFAQVAAEVLAIAARGPDEGRPIPVFNPLFGVQLRTIALHARMARRPGQSPLASLLRSAGSAALVSLLLATGWRVKGFSPQQYLAEVVANTDFRKYDDGLMLTLDVAPDVADEIEACLAGAARNGAVVYGVHRQTSATVTCVVPAATRADHIHFVDGAAGGYAMAAGNLKAAASRADDPVTSCEPQGAKHG